MALCDNLLSVEIAKNCDNVKGLEAEAVLINREDIDWDNVVESSANSGVYTAVPLVSGKKGLKCSQMTKGAFGGTQTALNDGTYVKDFSETLSFRIFDSGVIAAQAATELANATLVAIVKQKNQSADASQVKPIYRIYGLTGEGLMATEITNEPGSDDGNIWNVTMVSNGSTKAAAFLWDTDIATTDAKFKAYV